MSIIHDPALYQLRHALRGHVYDPGEPEYEDACTLFNGMIRRRPRHVARCSHPHQVSAALAFARMRGMRVAVRGGGHSVAGLSLVDDGLVIDVRGLRELVVDPERRVARVGGGLTWAEVDAATQEHGLATVGGRVSSTGVAGLTLGGGSGWLERKHGLACDNVLAVELVTATGERVRASADEHPELFWALRGGGGNFGVVTAIEFALHPVGPEVLAGLVLHPADRARELLRVFRDVMIDAPDEVSLAFVFLTAPDEDGIPARAARQAGRRDRRHARRRARGRGGRARARPRVRPARARRVRADPLRRVPELARRPARLPQLVDRRVPRRHGRGRHRRDRGARRDLPSGPAQIFIAAWGGAVARVPDGATPLTGRGARFVVHPLLLWEDADDDERTIAYGRRWRDVLAPYRTGATYLNFIGEEGADRVRAAYGPHYDRLARVKAGWDPDNVFRATGNVRSAD